MSDLEKLIELGQIKWTTKKKEKLTLADMGLRHLGNVLYLLERRIAQWDREGGSSHLFGKAKAMHDAQYAMLVQRKDEVRTYIALRETARLTYNGPKPSA